MLSESFEGHKVTPVKDFKAEDYEALLRQQPFCSQQFHEREITRFFYFSCQACVCQICIVTDHRNHEIVLLDKAAHDEKPDIISGAETIKTKLSELSEVIRQFEETIFEVENNVATAKREISQAAEQVIAEVRKREREAIISIESTRSTRLEKINSAMQEAQSLVKQMKQAAEFAHNLTERSSSSDIMRSKGTLKQRFEMLRVVEIPKHDETAFIKFSAAPGKNFKLGFIETIEKYKADAKRSTLERAKKTFQAGVEAEFTLCPKTSAGEISNQADLKNKVKVLTEPAQDVTNVIINEKEDGNLGLKFTPNVPGDYSIDVKINNEKLSTCPLTVLVKERELAVVGELDLKFLQRDVPHRLFGIAVNTEGNITVTDKSASCVYVFNNKGVCVRKIGRSKGAKSGVFSLPSGVSYLKDNVILVADQLNCKIQHLNIQTGTILNNFGKRGAEKGQFHCPIDVC